MVKGRDTHKQKVKRQRKKGLHIFIYLKITLTSMVVSNTKSIIFNLSGFSVDLIIIS